MKLLNYIFPDISLKGTVPTKVYKICLQRRIYVERKIRKCPAVRHGFLSDMSGKEQEGDKMIFSFT